jgi:hypothetical protein
MRILVINNDGGGFADYINVEVGLSVQQLFERQVPYGKPRDYLIRVNRQPTAPDQLLAEGDRVSFTPTKIEGAAAGGRLACCLLDALTLSSPCLNCHS